MILGDVLERELAAKPFVGGGLFGGQFGFVAACTGSRREDHHYEQHAEDEAKASYEEKGAALANVEHGCLPRFD